MPTARTPVRPQRTLDEGVARNLFIVRSVAGEAAFEQDEGVHLPWFRDKAALAVQIARDLSRSPAFPAGEGDVGMIGAALGLEADGLSDALDLCGESGERLFGFDAGPQRA